VAGTGVTTRSRSDGSVVIEVRGDLGAAATHQLQRALAHVMVRQRPARVVLDLMRAGRLPAESIGSVVAAHQVAADCAVAMVVWRPRPDVASLLRAAGLPGNRIRAERRLTHSRIR
jgi:anti-anti-sigma regulatory factor